MPAKKIYILSKKVHASTLSFGTTGRLTIQFGHATVYRHSFGNSQSMIAVSSYKQIFRAGACHTTGGNSLLPDISMTETPDLSFHLVFLFRHASQLPDQLP